MSSPTSPTKSSWLSSPVGGACARRALRPPRTRRLRARAPHAPRRGARRGRGAGGLPRRLAHGRPLRPRARHREHVDPDAGPPPRSRPRPARAAPARGADRDAPERAHGHVPADDAGSGSSASGAARPRRSFPISSARRSSSRTTAGSRSPSSQRGSASRSAPSRVGCSPDSPACARPGRPRRKRRRGPDAVHALTAAYALDALDEDEVASTRITSRLRRRRPISPRCSRSPLAAPRSKGPRRPRNSATGSSTRPGAERPNVVPLRPAPRVAAAPAPFAAAAVAARSRLGIWANVSLSNQLDEAQALGGPCRYVGASGSVVVGGGEDHGVARGLEPRRRAGREDLRGVGDRGRRAEARRPVRGRQAGGAAGAAGAAGCVRRRHASRTPRASTSLRRSRCTCCRPAVPELDRLDGVRQLEPEDAL